MTGSAIIRQFDLHPYFNQPIVHITSKWANNPIESDHAALKRITNPGKGFKTLSSAKATIAAVEAFRTLKRGDIYNPPR